MPIESIRTPDINPEKQEKQEVINMTRSELLPIHETLQVKKIVESIRLFCVGFTPLSSNFSPNRRKKNPDEQTDDFVAYIIQWKLWSGEDADMEKFYTQLAYYTPISNQFTIQPANTQSKDLFKNNLVLQNENNSLQPNPAARKLKYIMDNKWKSILTILQEIEEMEKEKARSAQNIQHLSKSESDSIPQSLRQKWISLFKRWYEVIAESISWNYEAVGEIVNGIFRKFISFFSVKSSPIERSQRWTTLCSKTAQINAKKFWIILPSWNAKEWVHAPIQDKTHFVNTINKVQNGNKCIEIEKCAPDSANFADISVESDTPNWKKYGHRAVAFKTDNWMWFILDPYYKSFSKGTTTKEPMQLNDYSRHWRIEQVNFYNAPIQTKIA